LTFFIIFHLIMMKNNENYKLLIISTLNIFSIWISSVVPIHVHNESARNATTTIQAAIKKLSVVEQYTLSTIPLPSQFPVNHTIFPYNFFYRFFINSQLIETFHMNSILTFCVFYFLLKTLHTNSIISFTVTFENWKKKTF
jgi:hypothetical protein